MLQHLGIGKNKQEKKADPIETALSQKRLGLVESIFGQKTDAMTKMKAFAKDVCVPEVLRIEKEA